MFPKLVHFHEEAGICFSLISANTELSDLLISLISSLDLSVYSCENWR